MRAQISAPELGAAAAAMMDAEENLLAAARADEALFGGSVVDLGHVLVAPNAAHASAFACNVTTTATVVSYTFATTRACQIVVRVDEAVSVKLQKLDKTSRWLDQRMLPTQLSVELDGVYRLVVYRAPHSPTRVSLAAQRGMSVVGERIVELVRNSETAREFLLGAHPPTRAPQLLAALAGLMGIQAATTLRFTAGTAGPVPTLAWPPTAYLAREAILSMPVDDRYHVHTVAGSDGQLYEAHWHHPKEDGRGYGLIFRSRSAVPVFRIEADTIVGCSTN